MASRTGAAAFSGSIDPGDEDDGEILAWHCPVALTAAIARAAAGSDRIPMARAGTGLLVAEGLTEGADADAP